MADGSANLNSAVNAQIADRALQYGTPSTIPFVQRSAYLADALQAIRQGGGQNLRTAGALGSNLLAEAIDQFASRRANQQLLQHEQSDQSAFAAALAGSIPGLGSDGAPGGASGDGGAGSQPPVAPPAVTAPAGGAASAGIATPPGPAAQPPSAMAAAPGGALSPPAQQGLANALNPADEDAAIRTVWGEARGEGAQGQQAVAGVMKNRHDMTGLPLATIAAQPHQFAGYSAAARALDPNSPAYQAIKGAIDPVLMGQAPNPAGTADHFYAPAGMPNGQAPSWAVGQPQQQIGHQDFLSLGFGGHPAGFNQSNPSSGSQSTATAAQAPPAPKPLQVSTGPDNSLPAPNVQGPSAATAANVNPAPSSLGPANSAPPPQSGGAASSPGFGQPGWTPPPVPISQAQQANLQRLRGLASQYPQVYLPQLQQYVGQLRDQMATPEPIDVSRPNDAGQVTITGKVTGRVYGVQGANGAIIAAGPKMVVNGAGGQGAQGGPSIQPVQSTMPTTQGQTAPGTVTQTDALGKTSVVQGPQWGSDTVLNVRDSALKSDQYSNYVTSNNAWKSMVANASSQNGMSGYAMRDTFARIINPGAVARVGTIQAIKDSPDIPDQVKGMLLQLGPGGLPPQIAQQLLDAALPFAQANDQAARVLNQANQGLAQRHGFDPQDVMFPMDTAPQRFVVGAGGAPGAPGAPAQPRPGGLPPGWPTGPDGRPIDPNSQAGKMAQQFIQRGLHYNPQTGGWQ